MKWHDARVEAPNRKRRYLVRNALESGSFRYYPDDEDFNGPVWYCHEGGYLPVSESPFYASAEEIEKELEKNE